MSRTLLLAAVIALSPAVVFAQGATTPHRNPRGDGGSAKAPAVKADEPKSPAVTAPAATVAGDKAPHLSNRQGRK